MSETKFEIITSIPVRDYVNGIISDEITFRYAKMREILTRAVQKNIFQNIADLQVPQKAEEASLTLTDFLLSIALPAVISELSEFALKKTSQHFMQNAEANIKAIKIDGAHPNASLEIRGNPPQKIANFRSDVTMRYLANDKSASTVKFQVKRKRSRRRWIEVEVPVDEKNPVLDHVADGIGSITGNLMSIFADKVKEVKTDQELKVGTINIAKTVSAHIMQRKFDTIYSLLDRAESLAYKALAKTVEDVKNINDPFYRLCDYQFWQDRKIDKSIVTEEVTGLFTDFLEFYCANVMFYNDEIYESNYDVYPSALMRADRNSHFDKYGDIVTNKFQIFSEIAWYDHIGYQFDSIADELVENGMDYFINYFGAHIIKIKNRQACFANRTISFCIVKTQNADVYSAIRQKIDFSDSENDVTALSFQTYFLYNKIYNTNDLKNSGSSYFESDNKIDELGKLSISAMPDDGIYPEIPSKSKLILDFYGTTTYFDLRIINPLTQEPTLYTEVRKIFPRGV